MLAFICDLRCMYLIQFSATQKIRNLVYYSYYFFFEVKGEKDIHDLMLAEKGFISFEEKGAYINKTVANTITTNTQFFASAAEEELSCIEYVQQTKLDQGTSMLVMKSVVRAEDSPISMHMFLSKRGLNSILRWIKIWKEQSRGFIFRRDEKRHDIQTFALAQVEPTYGQDFHVAPKTTNASNEVLQHCQRNYLPPLGECIDVFHLNKYTVLITLQLFNLYSFRYASIFQDVNGEHRV